MEKYDWEQLTPLFWSEISSSYMISNIFNNHREITRDFLLKKLNIEPERIQNKHIIVSRERNYPKKGHIDVFISVEDELCVLIEVKVHDYASARDNQLFTYYNAVSDNLSAEFFKDIYVVYLTQYNEKNISKKIDVKDRPYSIQEYAEFKKKNGDKSYHFNWNEFHEFIERYIDILNKEERLIVGLHQQWIKGKENADTVKFNIEIGKRKLKHYFKDIDMDLSEKISWCRPINNILKVNLNEADEKQLGLINEIIEQFINSQSIDRIKIETKEYAKIAKRKLMDRLQGDYEKQKIFNFYSELFNIVESRQYIQLEGTGREGISIKAKIKEKGMLSICTINTNQHTVYFKLVR